MNISHREIERKITGAVAITVRDVAVTSNDRASLPLKN